MIKRMLIGLLMTLATLISLVVVELAQAQLFDLEKSRQEIETMRGILTTTLDYALKGTRHETTDPNFGDLIQFNRFNRVNGYYLYGQGALFTISLLPPLPVPPHPPAPPVPPAPLAPPVPPVPPLGDDDIASACKGAEAAKAEAETTIAQARQRQAEASRQVEMADKQLADLQQKMGEWRKQNQAARTRLKEQMAIAKVALVDALAKHGDSLTVVKPHEYITIVISADSQGWDTMSEMFSTASTTQDQHRQFISVKRSVVTDYKAGRISLDELKREVLSYID